MEETGGGASWGVWGREGFEVGPPATTVDFLCALNRTIKVNI